MRVPVKTALAFIGVFLAASSAAAAGISSVYTDFSLNACKTLAQNEEEGGSYEGMCPGHAGIPVYFGEGDLRQFVAFGENGRTSCAATQTFGHFNHIGRKIEWRLDGGKPFATILRWFESDEYTKRQWLVVTRLGDQQCHVAYVDGSRPNANDIAREKADTLARSFDCAKDAIVIVAGKAMTAGEIAMGEMCSQANRRE